MLDFAGKRVVITGAVRGIGRLMAEQMAAEGAHVILWDLDHAGLAEAEAAFARAGRRVSVYRCDMADRAAIYATASRVLAECGPVDVVVNNAGIVSGRPLLEISDEMIERTFAVNTLALFWTTRAFLPAMLAQGRGHIVTIASAGGLVGTARLVDYCASKFAAVGFDDALRLELRRQGAPVRTTVVCPFYIATGMFAGVRTRFPWLLPILEPEDAAGRIVAGIRAERARVIMPWSIYSVFPARLLPPVAFDAIMQFLGVSKSMDEFTGHAAPVARAEPPRETGTGH